MKKENLPIITLGTRSRFILWSVELNTPNGIIPLGSLLKVNPDRRSYLEIEFHRDELTRWRKGRTKDVNFWRDGRRQFWRTVHIYNPLSKRHFECRCTVKKVDEGKGVMLFFMRNLMIGYREGQ